LRLNTSITLGHKEEEEEEEEEDNCNKQDCMGKSNPNSPYGHNTIAAFRAIYK
jgi:hypothetical protein